MIVRLGFRGKFLTAAILALLPLLALVVLLSIFTIRSAYEAQVAEKGLATVRDVATRIRIVESVAASDVVFLSRLPGVNTVSYPGKTRAMMVPAWAENRTLYDALLRTLGNFMQVRKLYDQVRILGADGMEIMRINMVDGKPSVVPHHELQFKGNRYYFYEAISLPVGEVYVSFLDLNQEKGQVEQPPKPVVRFVTPLRSPKGDLLAVVVLNVLARPFLSQTLSGLAGTGSGYWLVLNQDGQVMHRTRYGDALPDTAVDFADGDSCEQVFGEQCSEVMQGGITRLSSQGQTWVAYSVETTLLHRPDRSLVFVHITPAPSIWAYLTRFGGTVSLVGALALLLALLLAWIGGNLIAQPLLRLTDTVQRFSSGEWEARSDLHSQDEMGRLAHGFNQMADRLRDSYRHMESRVTERTAELKETYQRLERSETIVRAILENTVDAIITINPQGVIQTFNKGAEKIFGYAPEEVLGKKVNMLMPLPFRKEHDQYLKRYLDTGEAHIIGASREVRGRRKDGTVFPISLAVSEVRLDDALFFSGIVRDLTVLKRTEEDLRRSQRMYQALTQASPVGIYRSNARGDFLFVNERWSTITGISEKEALGEGWQQAVYGPDRDKVMQAWKQAVDAKASFNLEYRFQQPDGSLVWVYGQAAEVLMAEDEERSWVGTVTDITAHKRVEARSQRLGRVLEDSVNEIYMFDTRTYKFTLVNRGGRENLGYTRAELHEMTPLDIKPEFTRSQFTELVRPLLDGTKSRIDFSTIHQRKNGTQYPVEVMLQISQSEDQPVFVAIIQDVTEKRKAQAELERLSLVAQRTDNAVMVTDGQGLIQWVNDAFVRVSGYGLGEVVGRKPRDFLQGLETSPEIVELMSQKLARGDSFRGELVNYSKYGRPYWIDLDIQAVRDATGRITNFVSVSRDITERKRIEDALRQQAQILDQTHDAVVAVDMESHVSSWNQGAQRLFGYTSEEMLGRNISRVFPPQYGEDFRDEVISLVTAQGQHEMEIDLRKKSGEIFTALTSLSVLRDGDGRPVGMVAYAVDISERKQAEQAIQRAAEAAEVANRAKSQFLANMSHELRTPLNAIIGFSEILKDQSFGELNPKQQRQTQHILDSGRHLLSLINDILDLSKVEAGKLELEPGPVELGRLLDNSLVLIKEKAAKHGIRLSLEMEPDLEKVRVTGDERKLKQVMFNLLSNAAKFTPDGGSIKVKAARTGDDLLVSVIDTGIGIPLPDQARIFEEFEQVDSSYSRNQEGTGLGLALTRRLVELHGGEISLFSEGEGKGSTFTFKIPFTPWDEPTGGGEEESPADKTTAAASPAPDKQTVLIVDDDPMSRELLKGYFLEDGFGVVEAADGESALRLARELHPVAITLDILLDGQNGLEVLQQLKSQDATRDIPVLLVSVTDEREKGLKLGAEAFFQKPVKKEDLFARLREVGVCQPGNLHNVLVVDDNPQDLEFISGLMAEKGCRVITATSGAEGIDSALRDKPDLIISELNTPGVNGWEIISTVRAQRGDWRPFILVYTAGSPNRGEKKRLAGEVQGVLRKGGGRDDLLRELLRLARVSRET